MPLSAAEIARQYRKRRDANPEQRDAYLKKERDRWRKDRDTGKKKVINDLTERGKRLQRKKWKEAKKAARAKARTIEELQTPAPEPLELDCPPQLGPSSDGPANQYRQKGNFYLLSTEPYKLGFENINWNYFEAEHGKGAPDGVGGALKRSADRAIKHGEDIPNALILYERLKSNNSSVELFYISVDDVESKPEDGHIYALCSKEELALGLNVNRPIVEIIPVLGSSSDPQPGTSSSNSFITVLHNTPTLLPVPRRVAEACAYSEETLSEDCPLEEVLGEIELDTLKKKKLALEIELHQKELHTIAVLGSFPATP
ncbi:hypothetical protein PO909_006404 [Leuciscus waleckii]